VKRSRYCRRRIARAEIPGLRETYVPLLDAYTKAGKAPEVAKLMQDGLGEARKALPKDSPQLAGNLAPYGVILMHSRTTPGQNRSSANAWPFAKIAVRPLDHVQPRSMLGGALWAKRNTKSRAAADRRVRRLKEREKTIPLS